jgi:hypothetical protein
MSGSASSDRERGLAQTYKNPCTWGYGTLTAIGSQMEWTTIDDAGIALNNAGNKPGGLAAFGWSLYRDTLTLSP